MNKNNHEQIKILLYKNWCLTSSGTESVSAPRLRSTDNAYLLFDLDIGRSPMCALLWSRAIVKFNYLIITTVLMR